MRWSLPNFKFGSLVMIDTFTGQLIHLESIFIPNSKLFVCLEVLICSVISLIEVRIDSPRLKSMIEMHALACHYPPLTIVHSHSLKYWDPHQNQEHTIRPCSD